MRELKRKRKRKNVAVRKVKERKRLIFLGFHRKPIKPQYGTHTVHIGHRCPLEPLKVLHLGNLLESVLEARAGK